MSFWDKKADELTVKDSMIFAGVITGVSFMPLAIITGVNRFSEWRAERRWRKEQEDNK